MSRKRESYVPDRGDVIFTNFDPAAGREMRLERPALVLTLKVFNEKLGLALVVPITSKVRGAGFEVPLDEGQQTRGVALCQHPRTIDFVERGIKKIERAPQSVTDEVLKRVRILLA